MAKINQSENNNKGMTKYLSPLGAWALAFGCAIGWSSFVMPGTSFLPIAGPLGTILGLLIGSVFITIISYNYSRLVQRYPDAGGAYRYTKQVLGSDHGFLCAWMLILCYFTLIWANAAAISLISRYLFGDLFCFGFSYEIAGYQVYFGEVLFSSGLMLISCLICALSKNLSKWIQIIGAILLFGGILVCFICVLIHRGGIGGIEPLFSKNGSKVVQVMGITLLVPWAFIGFESISHSAEEFRFSRKKILRIVIVSLIASVLCYMMLTVCAAASHPDGFTGWDDYLRSLSRLSGIEQLPSFYSAQEAMGSAGLIVLGIAAFSGIFTSMIGNIIALSRLLFSMSKDDLLPKQLKRQNRKTIPWAAILCIACFSFLIPLLGRTAINWMVEVTTIGATSVYAYTSVCAIVIGYRTKDKKDLICGIIGTVFACIIVVLYLIPQLPSSIYLPTPSYMILIIWCLLGMIVFRLTLKRDKPRKYGKSFIVWVLFLFMILLVSVVWMNRMTLEESEKISAQVELYHQENAKNAGLDIHDENVISTNSYMTDRISDFGKKVRQNTFVFTLVLTFALVVVFSIFSVIKKRQQVIEAERLQAEESNRAKTLFLSNMSHDIRTPMNAVTGYTALALQEENLPDNIRDYLEKIDYSGKHLLTLINDILDMSRIESGKVELDFQHADWEEILDETNNIFSIQMKTKKLTYTIDCSNIKNRYIICDKNRLDRVLLNLISNSYKFTPEGGSISVVLRQTGVEEGKGNYVLSVEDTGIGMSQEFVDHIFEPFERERTSTVTHLQGTGLGMAIAKSLVELMGGTISVQSEQNKGTKFTINLSFPITDEKTVMKNRPEKIEAEKIQESKRLLIVEDNPINSEIAGEILRRDGYEVECAENGLLASKLVAAAEPHYYDAILMDIMMPVMDGYEATKVIRAMDAERAKVPIIAITANTFDTDRQAAFDAGMNAHVSKPFEPAQLLEVVSKFTS